MGSSFSPKDEIWFLRVCHHISNAVCHILGNPHVLKAVVMIFLTEGVVLNCFAGRDNVCSMSWIHFFWFWALCVQPIFHPLQQCPEESVLLYECNIQNALEPCTARFVIVSVALWHLICTHFPINKLVVDSAVHTVYKNVQLLGPATQLNAGSLNM